MSLNDRSVSIERNRFHRRSKIGRHFRSGAISHANHQRRLFLHLHDHGRRDRCLSRSLWHSVHPFPLDPFISPSRPLVLGSRPSAFGQEWCIASEDCSFGPIGFERVRDVRPGEMIIIRPDGELISKRCGRGKLCPCLFEYIYLSRPDSVLNDISVYNFQLALGSKLAKRIRSDFQI